MCNAKGVACKVIIVLLLQVATKGECYLLLLLIT